MSAFERFSHRLAFWPVHCAALLLALVVLSAPAASVAAPGDRSKLWDTCRKDDGEAGLAACMAIINTRGIPARERATAYYNRCYNYIMRHDYRNALANCDRALEDNPSYVDAWMNRTLIRSGLGQLDLAVRDATQALAVASASRAAARLFVRDAATLLSANASALFGSTFNSAFNTPRASELRFSATRLLPCSRPMSEAAFACEKLPVILLARAFPTWMSASSGRPAWSRKSAWWTRL